MNLQQIEKLKGLIQTSPVLNSAERDEWLMLLDLMNEKQMQELEKILASAPAQSSESYKRQAPASMLPKPMPAVVATAPKEPLHLSHIINLPKISEAPLMQKPQGRAAPLPYKAAPPSLR